MSNNRTVAISGRSGCGNTTVSTLVAEELGFRMINYTFRSLADDLGISFEELCRRAEQDDSYDRMLDSRQVELAQEGDCVLGSRLAIWLLKDPGLTVYLNASLHTRAERIMNREGNDFHRKLEETRDRDRRDTARYRRIYGIDTTDYSFADLVIDTDHCDQYEAASMIADAWREKFRSLHAPGK